MAKQKRVNSIGLYNLAERMFVEDGLTVKAIYEALSPTGPSEQTLGKWRKGIENGQTWDEKRAQYLTAPNNIKKVLMTELEGLAKGHDAKLDVKSIKIVSDVLDKLSTKVSAQIVFAVFKEFDNWMAEQDPEKAVSFLEWHRLFLLHKAQTEN